MVMKKIMTTLLALVVSAGAGLAFEVDGIFYNEISPGQCEVTFPPDGVYDNVVSIPASVNFESKVFDVVSIGSYAFAGSEGLSEVSIPSGVASVGRNAFQNCSSLKTISFPKAVTTLNPQMFYGCSSLVSFSGNGIVSVGDAAFSGCSALTELSFSNDLAAIGEGAFRNCSALESFVIPDAALLGDGVFFGCSSLKSVSFNMESVPPFTFHGCSSLVSVEGFDGVSDFGDYSFYTCSSLSDLDFNPSLQRIGENAFGFCSSIGSLSISGSHAVLEKACFTGCSALSEVSLSGVYELCEDAFAGAEGLEQISLGEELTFIRERVFNLCPNIAFVSCLASTPPVTANNAFMQSAYDNAFLEVPDFLSLLYRQSYPWAYFLHIGEADVEAVEGDGPALSVAASGNVLTISGQPGFCLVTDLSGNVLFRGESRDGLLQVSVPSKGVYVVRLNDKSVKINV